jgi:hypothetical protein
MIGSDPVAAVTGDCSNLVAQPGVGGPGPSGYTGCADEGGSCSFSQPVDVAFGANGGFTYKDAVTGTITFNAPIVAVIFRNINLDNSDIPAGSPGTVYPTGYPLRGLVNAPVSFVTILGNVLTFDLSTSITVPAIDQVRVITQTPAPGTAALLGFAGVTCLRRRRQTLA